MSNQALELVELYLRLLDCSDPKQGWLPLLSDDVSYELFIAKGRPVVAALQGKANVQLYLGVLPKTYEIVRAAPRRSFATDDRVIVAGGECARLVLSGQVVATEWTGVFQIADRLIQKITMSIYRWKVLRGKEFGSTDAPAMERGAARRAAASPHASHHGKVTPAALEKLAVTLG